jgi:hypothetical protein
MGKEAQFRQFRVRLQREVLGHPVITANPYTIWFRKGQMSLEQAASFVVQFSVFSNEFLFAQLRKMVNAESIAGMRASKEILANEIGVGFTGAAGKSQAGELGSTTGSIEGGTFRFRAAHFELLVRMSKPLGLSFEQLGKRSLGTNATLHFCDELVRLYGNEDYSVASAASWAVENWAAAGFWDELVEGWQRFKQLHDIRQLNLAFFTWHARLEANHAKHTWDELRDVYFSRPVDEDAFVKYANEMLDGVYIFWQGLDEQRLQLEAGNTAGELKWHHPSKARQMNLNGKPIGVRTRHLASESSSMNTK